MENIKITAVNDEQFTRLTGISKNTFSKLLNILEISLTTKQSTRGRKKKLSLENCLLMTLEYLREYRTYFHTGKSYGVSESTAYKIIKWVENILIKHPDLALPGKKSLVKNTNKDEKVMLDATETPIERPKKSKNDTIQVKRRSIR